MIVCRLELLQFERNRKVGRRANEREGEESAGADSIKWVERNVVLVFVMMMMMMMIWAVVQIDGDGESGAHCQCCSGQVDDTIVLMIYRCRV